MEANAQLEDFGLWGWVGAAVLQDCIEGTWGSGLVAGTSQRSSEQNLRPLPENVEHLVYCLLAEEVIPVPTSPECLRHGTPDFPDLAKAVGWGGWSPNHTWALSSLCSRVDPS